MESTDRPDLIIPLEVWRRLLEHMRLCPDEVSIFGFLKVQDVVTLRLYDLAMPDQVVTVGSVDELGDGFARVQHEAMVAGRADDLTLLWHTHPSAVGAQLSPDDIESMHRIGRAAGQWFVSMVTTRLGHVTATLFQFDPFWLKVDLRVWCDVGINDGIRNACAEELFAHVTRRVPLPATSGYQPGGYDEHRIRHDELLWTGPRAGLIRLDNGRF